MAVSLSLIGGAGWQFFDDNGNVLSGGKIYTYAAGTTTPLVTYTSWTGNTPNTNPIILDAAGRTPQQIWSTEGILYKYVIRDANDVLIRTWDNIGGSVVASDLAQELANTSDNAKGDALIGFRQSNSSGFATGATARTVNDKLQEVVSVKDFGAVGDGVADDTAAIQAAINYCWTQYVRVFPAGVGLTFPAQSAKLVFPTGIYRITSTLNIATGQYEVINFEGEGNASILWAGGPGVAVQAIASSGTGIVTTPITWFNISIRKSGTQKETGSIAFKVERYSNFTVRGLGILGFDTGVLNQGAIDMHFDFENRAIENCNVGFITEQKTVSAGIMKPNLLTITNAYFIQCSQHAFWARRNPLESPVNNGTGSVITIENTNFQSDSAVAVNCEYVGEVPGFGSVALRNCWFEGAGNRLIRLNRARALVDSCFLYPGVLNEHPISIEITPTVRSRITFVNCDGFVFNSQADNTFTHGFTNTDAPSVTNSYVNDVFVTTPISNYVTNANTAIAAGAGIGHKLYVGQPVGEGDYPRFVSDASYMRGRLFYFDRGVTAALAPSATASVLDMGTEAGVWQVTVMQSDGGIVWRNSSEVFFNGAASSSVYTKVTSNVTVTVSGSNIILTNTNPTLTVTLSWVAQRMAVT